MRLLASALVLACAVLIAPGCGSGCCDDPVPGGGGGLPPEMAPTFLLEDVNDTSGTYEQLLSPRTRLGAVSAWYFGSAT